MRNNFFQKGQPLKTSVGEFILSYNKLDSHHYALERVQNCSNNYVFENYTSFQDSHFLRYFTCWEQEQSVLRKLQKQQNSQTKGNKKKSMNLNAFLNKKKAQINSQASKNDPLISNKSRKQVELKKQQYVKVKVVYVQLQSFQNVNKPNNIQQIKNFMGTIFLLAQAINKRHGIWPNMIPVTDITGNIRFIKKGSNKDQELVNLFQFLMQNRAIEEWSKDLLSIYEMYKINGQVKLLGSKIEYDLTLLYSQENQITFIYKGKKTPEKIKIIEPQILLLTISSLKIIISQYNISFSYIDENSREVTLENYLSDQIVLIGHSSNFIIKYLKTFRNK